MGVDMADHNVRVRENVPNEAVTAAVAHCCYVVAHPEFLVKDLDSGLLYYLLLSPNQRRWFYLLNQSLAVADNEEQPIQNAAMVLCFHLERWPRMIEPSCHTAESR